MVRSHQLTRNHGNRDNFLVRFVKISPVTLIVELPGGSAVQEVVDIMRMACVVWAELLNSRELLRQRTLYAAFREHVVGEGDLRTSGGTSHEGGRSGGVLQKVSHLRSTFGECCRRCVRYSGVRYVHVDCRY